MAKLSSRRIIDGLNFGVFLLGAFAGGVGVCAALILLNAIKVWG